MTAIRAPRPSCGIEHTFDTVAGPVGYAELHCHTNFSFLDGASHPEELVDEAARLGLAGAGGHRPRRLLRDRPLRGGGPGRGAARRCSAPSSRWLRLDGRPAGEHLVVLADGPVGYARLARAISRGQLAGEKGAPRFHLAALAEDARARRPPHRQPRASPATTRWFVLTGCRKGAVPRALLADGPAAARRALDRLVAAFGRDRVLVELWDHGDPLDRHRNDALAEVAARAGVDVVATNNVHYATPAQRPLATALAAIRRRPLARRDRRLAPGEPARAPAQRRPSSRAGSRAGPARSSARSRSRSSARSTCASPRPNLPDLEVPDGPHRHGVAARAHPARRRAAVPVDAPAARAGAHADRVRARRHRAARLPRLLPRARRHRGVLPRARTSTARVGAARPTARSATRSASPRPTRSRSACCSSGSSRPSATARPTSTSTSSTSAARR